MKKFVAFLLLFALALVFIGCGEEEGSKDVLPTKITLDASAEVIFVFFTFILITIFVNWLW